MVSGESALYLGRQYRIEVVQTGLAEIQFAQRFIIPTGQGKKRKEALRKWYIDKAWGKIIPRAKRYAHVLGVQVSGVKIVDNRFRWGSCTVNNNVNFNWRLLKAPMFVIDYVIVHELAHLLEANHTPLVLEHRSGSGADHGKGQGLVEGKWPAFGTGDMKGFRLLRLSLLTSSIAGAGSSHPSCELG